MTALKTLAAAAAFAFLTPAGAVAAATNLDDVRLADNVTRAENGYEPVTTQYRVANATNIFSTHFMYGGDVTGRLERGQEVEALAKVKGYDWVLVGRNGEGIGYAPISLLSPAHLYVP